MKLKRTLAVLLSAGLCMFSLAGCSDAGKNYANELAKNSKMQSQASQISGTMNLTANGETMSFNISGTGYSNGNKGFSDIKITESTGTLNFPEIKCYVDNGTSYINKSYFEGIYKMTGAQVPAGLANIKAEYIGIESGFNIGELQQLVTNPESLMTLGTTLFGNGDDITFTQSGRQYAFSLNADQMVNYIDKFAKQSNNNTSALSAEDIASMKNLLAGSTIKCTQSFTDTGSTVAMQMNIKVQNTMTVTATLNSTCQKADAKEIVMPASVVKLTGQQYANLLA